MESLVTIIGVVAVLLGILWSNHDVKKELREEFRLENSKLDSKIDAMDRGLRGEIAEMRADSRILMAHAMGLPDGVAVRSRELQPQ